MPSFRKPADAAKPRVLLVDDHRGLLDRVSTLLSDDFDVAGIATDGGEAIAAAGRIDPDLIVLDVNLPVLDGFQAMRELARNGSRASVVFLSTVGADEFVGQAFRCGARGYVQKSQIARDLVSALDHAHQGRYFLPSLTAMVDVLNGGGHAMQLHSDPEAFLDGLAGFFDASLRRGDATCIIATPDMRDGLRRRLHARGWDVGGPSGHERCLVFDEADVARRYLRDGMPDERVVAEIAAELDAYRRAVAQGPTSRLTIFGNTAEMLITGGNPAAAIALEQQWNRLTQPLPFLSLCGYATSCFEAPDLLSSAYAEHGTVSHAAGV